MNFKSAILTIDGNTYALQPDKTNSFSGFYVDFRQEPLEGGVRWSVFLHPKQDICLQGLELQFEAPLPAGSRFFANGYQSWSESRLYGVEERIPALRRLALRYFGKSGDDCLPGIKRGAGHLHSWSYTYIKKPKSTLLVGSLSERTGFTLFTYDASARLFTVKKDLDNLALSHSFPVMDVWMAESTEEDVFHGWQKAMAPATPTAMGGLGWTSWYRYFNNISSAVIRENLNGVVESQLPFRYFQIDDGWQQAVGDWFLVKSSFPEGMGAMAREIRAKGMLPGLWLAPFVAAKNSELARMHPEWLLKGRDNKPVKAGWSPLWGGWYYALDFYHPGVRDYLSGVFHMVLDNWGFSMLKLDFLFAVCLAPPPGKTRGAVMSEAMEFLRNLAGEKEILACGAPLGASFGQVDYCRVGGDVHLKWEHGLLSWLRFRERVSTLASLRSTLGRWQLNGRVFGNDPDVFILRNDRQKLSPVQQSTLLTVNALLGKVLFTSDAPMNYSPEQRAELESALEWRGANVLSVANVAPDVFEIQFENGGERLSAICNLTDKTVNLPEGYHLLAFETLVLKN